MIIFPVIPCWWHRNSYWSLNSLGCSWVASCSSLFESEESSSDPSGLLRALWELNSLFLSVYWTVWNSTLCFVLHLWLVLQHGFFVKDHISTSKSTLCLGIPKFVTFDLFDEPNEDILLRLGLQFIFFRLSTKVYVRKPKIRKIE